MTGEQLKLLAKMKMLIIRGNKRFASRNDRDYIQDLLNVGLSEDDAWQEILTLSSYNYFIDYKPFFAKTDNALIFKKLINGYKVYIKIKLEKYNNKQETVCLSFHIDHK